MSKLREFLELPVPTRRAFLEVLAIAMTAHAREAFAEPTIEPKEPKEKEEKESPKSSEGWSSREMTMPEQAGSPSMTREYEDAAPMCPVVPKLESVSGNKSLLVDPVERTTSLINGIPGLPSPPNCPGLTKLEGSDGPANLPSKEKPTSYGLLYGVATDWNLLGVGQDFGFGGATGVTPGKGEIFLATFISSNRPGEGLAASKTLVGLGAQMQLGVGWGDIDSGLAGESRNYSLSWGAVGVQYSYNADWDAVSLTIGKGQSNTYSRTYTDLNVERFVMPSDRQIMQLMMRQSNPFFEPRLY